MSKNSNVKGISSSSAFHGSQKKILGSFTEEEIKIKKTKNIQKTDEGGNTNLLFTSILRTAYSSSFLISKG